MPIGLNEVVGWIRERAVAAVGEGVVLDAAAEFARDKPSVTASLFATSRAAQLVIWETGEAQIEVVSVPTGRAIRQSWQPYETVKDVTAEIERLIAEVSGP